MKSENQCQRAQRLNEISIKIPLSIDTNQADLFSTRQIGDVLPALLGRHNTEDDSFRERIQTVD